MSYQLFVVGEKSELDVASLLGDECHINHADSGEQCLAQLKEYAEQPAVVLLPTTANEADVRTLCESLINDSGRSDLPIFVVADDDASIDRQAMYQAGCQQFISSDSLAELKPQVERCIGLQQASANTQSQLQHANNMVFSAMSDTSDLGVNIHFMVESNQCNTLQELGQRMFLSLHNYKVQASLQFRSKHGIFNMETDGSMRDREAVLLFECRDQGRYLDFEERCIMNYGCVSILVKNMPVDDQLKYGSVKDNIFSLLQGADARVKAIDNLQSLELESELVKRMAGKMRHLMTKTESSYQKVMQDIAGVVENMSERVDGIIQVLGMDEKQEQAFEEIMANGIADTSRIFNQGIRADEGLQQFLSRVDATFASGHADAAMLQQLVRDMQNDSTDKPPLQ